MTKLALLAAALLLQTAVFSQNSVGIGTTTPAASAQLDVTSTTRGVLVPRVNTVQMNAIASPATGLLVYNTTASAFAYRTASGWVFLTGNTNAGAGWSTLGNSGTNPTNNFIGTVDSRPVVVRQSNVRAGLLDSANTSWGYGALNPNSTGTDNTAMGIFALESNTTGYYNTANGSGAMLSNTRGNSNTANGYSALLFNTEGSNNTALGLGAGIYNSTGNSNVAVGIFALFHNTTRSNLVAVGDSALHNNGLDATQAVHGTANTAVGSKALFANKTGFGNTANGAAALRSNTLGNFNTANGVNALYSNSTGFSNTANGVDALYSNTTGIFNTANGISAMRFNTEGSNNTANGVDALLSNTTGNSNTAFGTAAGRNNQAGSGNVFIGNQAGFNETGSNKLYINNNNGNANNALLYGEFDTERLRIQNKLGIGRLPSTYPLEIQALAGTDDLLQFFNAAGTARWHLNLLPNGSLNFTESPAATNRLVLGIGGEVGVGKIPLIGNNDSRLVVKQKGLQNGIGMESSNSSNHWDFYVTSGTSSDLQLYYNGSIKGTFGNAGGVYAPSDKRLKKDIATYEPILNKLQQLEAFHYHYLDNKSTDPLSTGFMAQDVQKLFPDAVSEMDLKNGEKMLGINYQYFTVAAIKGLQEQQVMIARQEERIAKQEDRIAKLEALIKTISEKK